MREILIQRRSTTITQEPSVCYVQKTVLGGGWGVGFGAKLQQFTNDEYARRACASIVGLCHCRWFLSGEFYAPVVVVDVAIAPLLIYLV